MECQNHIAADAFVYIVDDDPDFRIGLANILTTSGYRVATFNTSESFFEVADSDSVGCVMLDMRVSGASGLEIQACLPGRNIDLPVILMAGHADVPSSVLGMKAGAIDFLIKPLDERLLLGAVSEALEHDTQRRVRDRANAEIRERHATLTPRERQVMSLVVTGLMNKQIAGFLELSEITVKVHRGTMMRKMALRTVPDLVRASEVLRLC